MQFSRNFLILFPVMQSDVELVGHSRHEGSSCVEVQQSDPADIVGGHILVIDRELEVKLRSSLQGDGQGLIPNNLGILISLDDVGLVLSSTVGSSQDLNPNEVVHLPEEFVALLEDGIGDGDFNAGHDQQNILMNIIY